MKAFRSYYLLQALAARYTQCRAVAIRYLDAQGRARSTTQAITDGSYRRSQVVTRYADGTVTAVNGNVSERMETEIEGRRLSLPVNGFWGLSGDGQVETFAGEVDGHRAEWCVSPDYRYLNGRGCRVQVSGIGAADGALVRIPAGEGVEEVVPFGTSVLELPYVADSVEALGEKGETLPPPEFSLDGGVTRIVVGKGVVSYRVTVRRERDERRKEGSEKK